MDTPLVTIPLKGGLGNQMFQIAGAYAYAVREGGAFRLQRMDRCGSRPVYWDTFFTSFLPHLVEADTLCGLPVWCEPSATTYAPPPPLCAPGQCIDGYLQSSKYFAEIAGEIRARFSPPPAIRSHVEEKYAYLIQHSSRVVVMHARRTDYLLHQEVHAPLLGAYYRAAVARVFEVVERPIFLLVSDDPSFWGCIEPEISRVFQGEFHILRNETDVNTMVLLQQFRYMVMSNSTYIWWAVWLANVKEKGGHVWVPARWFGPRGPQEYEDVYEPEWERIAAH